MTGRRNEGLVGKHGHGPADPRWKSIDVNRVDMDESTARRIVRVNNRSSDLACHDDGVLAQLLQAAVSAAARDLLLELDGLRR